MKSFLILLLLAFAAYGQQKRIAIINTVDDGEPPVGHSELSHLTDRQREIAVKNLPQGIYVMTQQSIVAFLGSQERAAKECNEATCLAELGRKVNADYVAQARIGRFGENLTIKTELYDSKNGNLMGSFTGNSKDIFGLLAIIDEEAPDLFRRMEKTAERYTANFSTDPPGAILSFDGAPSASCVKTPCSAELREGKVRIIATLENYETVDTTVSIIRNGQNIAIALKSNFGVLEIKPAYLDGIGENEEWDLTINDKTYYSFVNRLPTNKYSVKLNHECYENISFKVSINKGKREVFDMSKQIALKKGGLVLRMEQDGEPVSEPIFINGKQIGETPFSGPVPVCSRVEIGKNRETLDLEIKYKQTVNYTHRTESYTHKYEAPAPALVPVPAQAQEPFDASSIYFSFYRPSIISFYDYKGQKLRRSGLSAMLGFEGISKETSYGGSFFVGGGALGDDIREFILGVDAKRLLWLWPRRIAIPLSLGVAWRIQWKDIKNRLVAEFIDEPRFLQEPDDYLNKKRTITKHNVDIMPAMDLQIFIGSHFSLYGGYMYRVAFTAADWGFEYKILGKFYEENKSGDHFDVPKKYNPQRDPKEQVFGIPGTLRFGIKFH